MVEPIDNQTLLRRTLVAVAAMLGGCVVVVGMFTLIAVSIVGRAAPSSQETVPATSVHGAAPSVKPPSPGAAAK